jgi:uncharacterized phage protein (TIGR02218 family)
VTAFSEMFMEHLAGQVTSVCHCWRVIRRDESVLGFTDHDRTIAIDGVDFEPQSGLTASETRDTMGLSADATDVEGALSSDRISEADIAAGRYDGARVETLLVNWRAPEQHAVLRSATVGKIVLRDGHFVVELEGLGAQLDRRIGRTFRKSCDAELGDARCGFDLGAEGFSGAGVAVAVTGANVVRVSGLDGFAENWFGRGMLTWTSGASDGRQQRVASHRREGAAALLTLWDAVDAAPGDPFTIIAGCDKLFATCKAKFSNSVNFRGFPHMPGNDAGYAYVAEGVEFDGEPLVP